MREGSLGIMILSDTAVSELKCGSVGLDVDDGQAEDLDGGELWPCD